MVGHTTLLLDVDASAIGWCGLGWGWRGGVQRRDQDPYGSFRLPEVPSCEVCSRSYLAVVLGISGAAAAV